MNPIPRLSANKILNSPQHEHASIISDPIQLSRVHCHNYYEIFIASQGYGQHIVNGITEPIKTGALYFIRPDDVHSYINLSSNFQIINILIPIPAIQELFHYLGEDFSKELLARELPPRVQISMNEFHSLIKELEQLVLTKKILKEKSDVFFRITVFNILTKYFTTFPLHSTNKAPEWLKWLSLEMLKKENFVEGLPAFYRLSGKSTEHLSRACKKYLGKTPTQLINNIRLEYAASQIVNTNQKIIHVCEDSGFESLSHFYHIFKSAYGMSPKAYRKSYQTEQSSLPFSSSILYDPSIPSSLPYDTLV